MSLSLFSKHKEEFLVLDFGHSSIKGLVFEKEKSKSLPKGQVFRILKKFKTEKIEEFGVFSAGNFKVDIIKLALGKLLQQLDIKEQMSRMKTIVALPPDIVRAVVIDVCLARKKEAVRINREEKVKIDNIVEKRANEALSHIISNSFGKQPDDFQILRRQILLKRISGYQVPSLLGFRGAKLEFKVLIIFGPKVYLNFIESAIDVFGLEHLDVRHLVEGLAIVKKTAGIDSKIFIDIGKEFTQLFVFNSTLENVGGFKLGAALFSDRIKRVFGLSQNETEALKTVFSENKLSPGVREKIKQALEPAYRLWSDSFENMLKQQTRHLHFFSNKAVLFGGGSMLYGIKESIKDKSFSGKQFQQGLKPMVLNFEGLPIKDKTGGALSPLAVPAILMAFTN